MADKNQESGAGRDKLVQSLVISYRAASAKKQGTGGELNNLGGKDKPRRRTPEESAERFSWSGEDEITIIPPPAKDKDK